jgi:arylsulfatase A-like enzyme
MSQSLSEKRWPWVAASIVVFLMFVSAFIRIEPETIIDERPTGRLDEPDDLKRLVEMRKEGNLNVLFILIDTLRSSRLGSYDYERDTSPNLDRIAAEGVRFARNMSQSSWTKCSMASLWTGLNPARTGVIKFDDVIHDDAQMPAEILRDAGYKTVAIYRNGWVAPNFGFDQGFEVYLRPAAVGLPASVLRKNPTLSGHTSDQDATLAAEEFLRVHGHEPWFLYLHLMDVHEYVYDEDTGIFGSDISDIYDNSIRWTDRIVGRFLDYVEAAGLMENTIIVIAADHGEAFLERGYEGHARNVYPETTEVPLIIQLPFRLEPGVTVETRSRNVDIWPTILDLMGLDPMGQVDGRTLVPDMIAGAKGKPLADDRTGIAYLDMRWGHQAENRIPTVAVAEGSHRYVRLDPVGNASAIEELFDSEEDPAELIDLSTNEVAKLEHLRGVADAYLELEPAWETTPTRELGELERNQLRALGYSIP